VSFQVSKSGHPGEFQHTGGGEVDRAVGLDPVLGLEAGTPGAPGADLAESDDDDHVLEVRGDLAPRLIL
jgi:hypothetical protein